ncbi:MAG TPA: DUF423 domain-containing protein [Hyphomicrobium sp.]|jgi:uncharacterized membrane protein YgdD (TMEM256/DUF423 family)
MISQLAAALIIYAGLAGAAGVALAAVGAHGNDLSALTPPAYLLLMHAAAAVAIVAVGERTAHPLAFLLAAFVILLGASLFGGAVTLRVLTGARLFPMAAPTGGTTMIIGWLILAAAGLWELLGQRGQ